MIYCRKTNNWRPVNHEGDAEVLASEKCFARVQYSRLDIKWKFYAGWKVTVPLWQLNFQFRYNQGCVNGWNCILSVHLTYQAKMKATTNLRNSTPFEHSLVAFAELSPKGTNKSQFRPRHWTVKEYSLASRSETVWRSQCMLWARILKYNRSNKLYGRPLWNSYHCWYESSGGEDWSLLEMQRKVDSKPGMCEDSGEGKR